MDIRIDSSPCADDHSSPRSPLHVLCTVSMAVRTGGPRIEGAYPKMDLYLVSSHSSRRRRAGAIACNVQTDFALCVDVRIETRAAAVGGERSDAGCLCRIVCFGRNELADANAVSNVN